MSRFWKSTVVGVALAVLTAGAAQAQTNPMMMWQPNPMFDPGHPYGYGGAMGMGHGRRPIVDVNGDGVVGADEAASMQEGAFDAMDADGDGTVGVDEFVAFPAHGGGMRQGFRRQQQRAERFESIDADNDGALTRAEYMRAGKARYEAADTDGDGVVTVWEWRAAPRY